MLEEVGSYHTKTKLPEILRRVETCAANTLANRIGPKSVSILNSVNRSRSATADGLTNHLIASPSRIIVSKIVPTRNPNLDIRDSLISTLGDTRYILSSTFTSTVLLS